MEHVNGDDRNCRVWKKKLQMLDFAIVDTVLYLDAYPACAQALEYYHKLLAEREQVAKQYAEACGPLTAWDNVSRKSWDWAKGPWPWQTEAN